MAKQVKGRYCKRRRRIMLAAGWRDDGTAELGPEVRAPIARYRFGERRRKPHYVYWWRGGFYRARNLAVGLGPDGEPCAWEWALVPIEAARCWDAFRAQTAADGRAAPVRLEIRAGKVARAVGEKGTPWEGLELLDGSEPAGYVAGLLDLETPGGGAEDVPRPAGRHYREAA